MEPISVTWTWFKNWVFNVKNLVFQEVIDTTNTYNLFASDGTVSVVAKLEIQSPPGADQSDYETNYQSRANQLNQVPAITAMESNAVTLKICKAQGTFSSGTLTLLVQCPGTFGTGPGRLVQGGYLQIDTFDPGDYVQVYVEDTNREIAWALALAANTSATSPLTDAEVIAAGTLPAPFNEAFPSYPIVGSYSDDELDVIGTTGNNQFGAPNPNMGSSGWYFWPIANGNNIPPSSETDVEAFGYWGFIASAFFLKAVVTRTNSALANTGLARLCVEWAVPTPS